ncbi:hypothetical protein niasHT_033735 [Heterodera trifolii]|uniref:Uncharacterized protein n=1 Tax=Heterodera trifolii TaxID=157864 RepID=A0ABD2IU42_9BILA
MEVLATGGQSPGGHNTPLQQQTTPPALCGQQNKFKPKIFVLLLLVSFAVVTNTTGNSPSSVSGAVIGEL